MNSNIPITWESWLPAPENPFHLNNLDGYHRWRETKLAAFPGSLAELSIEVKDPYRLSRAESAVIHRHCRRANMALLIFSPRPMDPQLSRHLGAQLGLHRIDGNLCADDAGVSAIEATRLKHDREYIPYSQQPLSWHTDGYYNAADTQVRAWSLLCVRAAVTGGENELLDHEIAYIWLRDQAPELVGALMDARALTIPANVSTDSVLRPDSSGPVFSVDQASRLHMRFSQRKRHLIWKDDDRTQAAVALLDRLFSSNLPQVFRHRLEPGQCLLTNNVLHNRSGFSNPEAPNQGRLLYRIRYLDRIGG